MILFHELQIESHYAWEKLDKLCNNVDYSCSRRFDVWSTTARDFVLSLSIMPR